MGVVIVEKRWRAAFLCIFFFLPPCLCAAGRLRSVPHESGGGTAALSGDKVIRTGNNERERKS